jgi:hypothetical protein
MNAGVPVSSCVEQQVNKYTCVCVCTCMLGVGKNLCSNCGGGGGGDEVRRRCGARGRRGGDGHNVTEIRL